MKLAVTQAHCMAAAQVSASHDDMLAPFKQPGGHLLACADRRLGMPSQLRYKKSLLCKPLWWQPPQCNSYLCRNWLQSQRTRPPQP